MVQAKAGLTQTTHTLRISYFMAQHSITIAFDHVNFYIIYEIDVVHTIRKTDHQKICKNFYFLCFKKYEVARCCCWDIVFKMFVEIK